MPFDEQKLSQAIAALRDPANKRKFSQTVDLIVNLKNLDLKKVEQQVDYYTSLTHPRAKKSKVCALVATELIDNAKEVCDKAIHQDEFDAFMKEPAKAKKLAKEYDFFIAQANIMPAVAKAFGKVLGTRKKMPNPKAGCVVPPKSNLKPLYDRLQNTIRVYAKEIMIIQIPVGEESMDDKTLKENINAIYDGLIHHLPGEKNNVRSVYIKLTMSKPARLE